MASGYDPAGREVLDCVDELVTNFYPDFVECQLKIGVMMAYSSELGKPALLVQGYPQAATIRKISVKDRAQGMPDLTIYLDSQSWANFNDDERKSELDKQLARYEVVRDKKDKHIKTDSALRPLLKVRPYDYLLSGYDIHIRRYGTKGVDAKAIEELSLHYSSQLPISSPRQLAV